MAAESKRLKLMEESTRDTDPPSKYTPSTMFSSSDVTLVVEGFKLHVHKQLLTDNSPVFKRMLESDFKGKHQKEIPLPGEKFKEFEDFLRVSIILISNVLSQVCKAIAQRRFIFKRARWSLLRYTYPRNALY